MLVFVIEKNHNEQSGIKLPKYEYLLRWDKPLILLHGIKVRLGKQRKRISCINFGTYMFC